MSGEEKGRRQGPQTELMAFIDACRTSLDEARAMLARNPRLIHARTPHVGETALHFCAIEDELDAVRWLHSAGADLHTRNDFGDTPLSDAASLGYIEMTRFFHDAGAEIDPANESGETPLYRAAAHDHAGTVALLLELGADPSKQGSDGTPLHTAAFMGSLAAARALLLHGVDIEARNSSEMTPLNVAVWSGKPEVVKLLVEHGAKAFEPSEITLLDIAKETLEKDPDDPGLQETVRFLTSLRPPQPGAGSPADVAALHRRDAASYGELWAPLLVEPARRLLRELASPDVREVLDVGAGVGSLLPELEAAFPAAHVTQTDLSLAMLALAPPAASRAVMDAARLGVRNAAVDRVVMAFMLFHLSDPLAGLREARRVLAPGGRVGTLTWGAEMTSPAMRVWAECLDEFGQPAVKKTDHAAVGSTAKMEAFLAEAGFASPRAWTEELVAEFPAERLIRLRTELKASRPRFDALAPETRTAFLAELRRRLARLAPEDFVGRATVVFAIGTVDG